MEAQGKVREHKQKTGDYFFKCINIGVGSRVPKVSLGPCQTSYSLVTEMTNASMEALRIQTIELPIVNATTRKLEWKVQPHGTEFGRKGYGQCIRRDRVTEVGHLRVNRIL